jgi:hypothetical protein
VLASTGHRDAGVDIQTHFNTRVFSPELDCLNGELECRFSDQSKSIMLEMECLNPTNENFLDKTRMTPFINLYKADTEDLSHELYQLYETFDAAHRPAGIYTAGTTLNLFMTLCLCQGGIYLFCMELSLLCMIHLTQHVQWNQYIIIQFLSPKMHQNSGLCFQIFRNRLQNDGSTMRINNSSQSLTVEILRLLCFDVQRMTSG